MTELRATPNLLRVAPLGECNNATTQQQLPDATAKPATAVCCVLHPPTRATAQQTEICATGRATSTQQPSLKALARKVLQAQQAAQQARNNAPNVVADAQPRNEVVQQQRHRLLAAARELNIPRLVIAELPDAEIDGCQWLDEPGIRRYAQIVLENWLTARGVLILHPTDPTRDLARYRITTPELPR